MAETWNSKIVAWGKVFKSLLWNQYSKQHGPIILKEVKLKLNHIQSLFLIQKSDFLQIYF